MIKLITTDSYYNVFKILNECLAPSVNSLQGKNLVFCEEKISLMAERAICARFNGSFNTDVYSFGNYLRSKHPLDNVLTREGSSMVVKKVISSLSLNCFKSSKTNLAPTMYNLIIQLKSAKITPAQLIDACAQTEGVLHDKLQDVASIYQEYENYLKNGGLEDQSSMLSYLPSLLENTKEILESDVYLIGFSSFTRQTKSAIEKLISKAKSVTAILVEGENSFAYLNETSSMFRSLCIEMGVKLEETKIESAWNKDGKLIVQNIFSPLANVERQPTERIHSFVAKDVFEECMAIATTIKKSVIDGQIRYKQAGVILPDFDLYKDSIKQCFDLLEIPCFIDQKIKPHNHPLILLIIDYVDLFRKGFTKKTLCNFIKNPVLGVDNDFSDRFISYLKRYNCFYSSFTKPLKFPSSIEGELEQFENHRKFIRSLFNKFDPMDMLDRVNAKQNLENITQMLASLNQMEESAINEQIFDAVSKILVEMSSILKGVELSYTEFKNVFISGISTLELSIIPQFNDAVFVGGFKEASLYPARYLFAPGLTVGVPNCKDDVALLADYDIDALEKLKVYVEPKIQVINKRERETVALGITAFTHKLFLSYPLTAKNGSKNIRGEIFNDINELFDCAFFQPSEQYFTEKQGKVEFSKSCSKIFEGEVLSQSSENNAQAFYHLYKDSKDLSRLANLCQRSQKIQLERSKDVVVSQVTSPTAIEEYYRCPYKVFLSRGLKLKESDDGERVDSLSFGLLIHEVLSEYISKISTVTDKRSSDALVESIAESVISRDEYKRFLEDESAKASIVNAVKECKAFCYKNYLYNANSQFSTDEQNVEVGFGIRREGKKYYPALSLLDGRVKLTGVIDRVDTYGDYCRIIDYKTGSYDADLKTLYSGQKLQLYLYAKAVNDKKVAGMYYFPTSNAYKSESQTDKPLAVGRTLNDMELIIKQDGEIAQTQKSKVIPVSIDKNGLMKGASSEDDINAFIKYATLVSENAVSQMADGVIVASPYEKSCSSCPFIALCGREEENGRVIGSVNEDKIIQAVKEVE